MKFAQLGRVLTNDTPTLQLYQSMSGGGFTAYTATGTSVDKDILSGKVSLTSAAYAKSERVRWVDLKDNPELAPQRAASLANRAMVEINEIGFDGLEALFTTNHPLTGAGAGQVGTKKVIAASLGYAQTLGNAGTQTNLFTTQLSRTSLELDIETLSKWRAVGDGALLDLGADESNLVLVCDPQNTQLAKSLRDSSVKDSNMQNNTLQGGFSIVDRALSDADDYFLIDRSADVCGVWVREFPTITVSQTDNLLDVIFTAKFQASFWYSIEGHGIMGHNVA
jgi:hypothetical protein